MKNRKSETGSSGSAVGPTVLGVLIGVGVAAFIDTTLPMAFLVGGLVSGLATMVLLAIWPSRKRPGDSGSAGDGGVGVYGGWDSGDGGGCDGGGGGGD